MNPRRPEYDVGVLQSRTANFGLSRRWKKWKDVSYEITRSAFVIGIDKGVIYCQARRINTNKAGAFDELYKGKI